MNVTDLEKKAMHAIATSEYHDGRPITENPVWVDCLNVPYEGKVLRGVLSSLVKKGWANVQEYDKGQNVVSLTDEGYQVYLANKP
jgi:hypothetical protein